jgi:hypothetical protein
VFTKVLSGSGRRAVLLVNRGTATATITARWLDLGLTSAAATARNLWTATTTTGVATSFSASVPAGDSVLLTVTGTEAAATTYEAEAAANTRTGSAAPATCAACSGASKIGAIGNGSANTLRFNGIAAGATGLAVATIAYANGDPTTRAASLVTNGQGPTVIGFPPTGSWTTPGTVSVIVSLRAGTANTLTLSNAAGFAPDLDAIAISPLPGSAGVAIVGAQSSRCVDVDNNTLTNGTQTQLWDCTGGPNQTWVHTASRQLMVYGNKCLDANNSGTTNGTAVIIWDCNGQSNQQWTVNSNGTITGVQSGLCLDASSNGTANGTHLILWACGAGTNQQWTTR